MSLRQLVVLLETPAACAERLVGAGTAPDVAEEIAFYLAQADDFLAMRDDIATALASHDIDLAVHAVDATDEWPAAARRKETLIWVLTDGSRWYRGSLAAATVDLLGLRRFGSPAPAHATAQDKFRCLALAAAAGIATPPTVLVEGGMPLSPIDVLPAAGQLFVKPNTLGAKIGIGDDACCDTLAEALALGRRIHARYADRALIQSYIAGRDVRVSFMDLGDANGPLGIAAVEAGSAFATHERSRAMTRLAAAGTADGITVTVDDLDRAAAAAVGEAAWRVARAAGLRHCWSMDFRLDEDGTPWFLELEVCPAVTIYDFRDHLRRVHGCDLPKAITTAACSIIAL